MNISQFMWIWYSFRLIALVFRIVWFVSTYFSLKWSEVKSLSHVQLFSTPWTVARQVLLSMEIFRQEYWSGLPFLPPKDLPDPGIKISSPKFPALAGRFFTTRYIYTEINFGKNYLITFFTIVTSRNTKKTKNKQTKKL